MQKNYCLVDDYLIQQAHIKKCLRKIKKISKMLTHVFIFNHNTVVIILYCTVLWLKIKTNEEGHLVLCEHAKCPVLKRI